VDLVTVRRLRWGGVVLTLALILGIGAYVLFSYTQPYLHGTGCAVDGSIKGTGVDLDLEQAANAATIAAVARHRRLPDQALVIAYATVIQESKIHNLPAGDRDSIGLFQQRPSQGWGTPAELADPVVATGKFFDVLKEIKNYDQLPVDVAAQRVQRSADGSAYAFHVYNAKILTSGFMGRQSAAVHCWYAPDRQTASRIDALPALADRAFGEGQVSLTTSKDDLTAVDRGDQQYGWALASWAVSYAQGYGIREIRYAGRHWTSENGFSGWTRDDQAQAGRVVIR
jgi:hypothetical protein